MNSVGRSFRLGQQALEIQRPRRHGDGAVGGPGPFALWSVAVQLDAVAVGVPQVDRFADAVVGCSFERQDRKSTRLNSSHRCISYAVFCLKKKKTKKKKANTSTTLIDHT